MTSHEEDQFSDFGDDVMSEVDQFYTSICSESSDNGHEEKGEVEETSDSGHEEEEASNGDSYGGIEESHDEDYDDINVSNEEINRLKRAAVHHQGLLWRVISFCIYCN